MRLLAVLILLFIGLNSIHSQHIYVTDMSGKPISDVFVFNNNFQELSDKEGKISIPPFEEYMIQFTHVAYGTVIISHVDIKMKNYKIVLECKDNMMKDVVLIGRTGKQEKEIFQQLETIKLEDLTLNQAQSTPDLLQNHSGVFIQKSQMGGGSPIVRGFEANKLLLVQDGVRLNNAIYRNGHLHNILSIDEQALEKIDVIYGPGSLNYGSDAIGGVLHFVSKQPKLGKQFANYFSSFASANNGFKSYVDFNLSTKKIASLTSLSYGNFGNLRTGNNRTDDYPDFGKRPEYVSNLYGVDVIVANGDPNLQIGTAYSQWNIANKTKFLINNAISLMTNLQWSTSSDVPRYDRLTEYKGDKLKFAEWNYGPQESFLASATIDWYPHFKIFDEMKTILSYQKIKETRIKRKFQNENRTSNHENVDVAGLTIDFVKQINPNHKITYGIDYQYNDVSSEGISYNIIDKTSSIASSQYPNGSNSMKTGGLYVNYFIQNILKNLHFSGGMRYQTANVELEFIDNNTINWPLSYYNGISSDNQAITASAALKWELNRIFEFNWMSASAFRSPNIDDMAKVRIKGDEITMVNVELVPEKSISHELSVRIKPTKCRNNYLDLSVYRTNLKDAIVRNAFQFDDSSIFITDGDTLNIVANVNASNANVKGISGKIQFELIDGLIADLSVTKIVGKQKIKDSDGTVNSKPMDHIPPMYARANLKYKKGKLTTKIAYKYYDKKELSDYGGSTDNLVFATVDGTPQYHLWDIHASYQVHKLLVLNVAVKNIFDTHYRLFASGVSGTGRNLVVSVKGTI